MTCPKIYDDHAMLMKMIMMMSCMLKDASITLGWGVTLGLAPLGFPLLPASFGVF